MRIRGRKVPNTTRKIGNPVDRDPRPVISLIIPKRISFGRFPETEGTGQRNVPPQRIADQGGTLPNVGLRLRLEPERQTILNLAPAVFTRLRHYPKVVADGGVHDAAGTESLRLRPRGAGQVVGSAAGNFRGCGVNSCRDDHRVSGAVEVLRIVRISYTYLIASYWILTRLRSWPVEVHAKLTVAADRARQVLRMIEEVEEVHRELHVDPFCQSKVFAERQIYVVVAGPGADAKTLAPFFADLIAV